MFVYFGDVKEVTDELSRHQKRLEMIYGEILPRASYVELQRRARELLGPESFWSLEKVSEHSAQEIRSSVNKFLVGTMDLNLVKVSIDGTVETMGSPCVVRTAPAFVFSRKGFEIKEAEYRAQGVSPYLASYLHEFHHFLCYALVPVPTMFAMLVMHETLQPPHFPITHAEIYSHIREENIPRQEKLQKIMLGLFFTRMWEYEEYTARFIDNEVLSRLGYGSQFYEQPRGGGEIIDDPQLRLKLVFPFGDPLYGFSIAQRITVLRDWRRRLNPSNVVQKRFVETFKGFEVQKWNIRELTQM